MPGMTIDNGVKGERGENSERLCPEVTSLACILLIEAASLTSSSFSTKFKDIIRIFSRSEDQCFIKRVTLTCVDGGVREAIIVFEQNPDPPTIRPVSRMRLSGLQEG